MVFKMYVKVACYYQGAGRISYFAEPTMLWLAGTLMGEAWARSI